MKVQKMGKKWGVQFFYPRAALARETGTQPKRYRWRLSENKKSAEKQAFDIEASIRDNTFIEKYIKPANTVSLKEGVDWYLNHYVQERVESEKSRKGVKRILGNLLDILGDKAIDTMGFKDIEKYKMTRLKNVSKPSVDRELGTISGLFTRLARYEVIQFNPVAGKIELFHEKRPRRRVANLEEIKLIFSKITHPELWMIAFISMTTGIRLSDICSLSLSNIDWDLGVLDFSQGKVKHSSSRAKHIIPMTSMVRNTIQEYIDAQKVTDKLFTFRPEIVSMLWSVFMKTLNLPDPIQFRDLRRTFSTMLRGIEGMDIHLIADLLGHSGMDVANEHYIVTQVEMKRRFLEEKDKGIEGLFSKEG